eukprot:11436180-Ditylum_brightwellii.AAC.1
MDGLAKNILLELSSHLNEQLEMNTVEMGELDIVKKCIILLVIAAKDEGESIEYIKEKERNEILECSLVGTERRKQNRSCISPDPSKLCPIKDI